MMIYGHRDYKIGRAVVYGRCDRQSDVGWSTIITIAQICWSIVCVIRAHIEPLVITCSLICRKRAFDCICLQSGLNV